MNNKIPIALITDMVEQDLTLAWDHLQDGSPQMAIHQLNQAIEKISQIQHLQITQDGGLPGSNPRQQAVMELEVVNTTSTTEPTNHDHHQGNPERSHPQIKRRTIAST